MNAAACFMCLEPKQLMAVRAVLLCQILQVNNPMASCDPTSLMAAAACFDCLDLRQLSVIQTQLLCEILQTGSATANCIICGDDDPSATPPCDCAVAYNRVTGGFWYWDANETAWVQLLV